MITMLALKIVAMNILDVNIKKYHVMMMMPVRMILVVRKQDVNIPLTIVMTTMPVLGINVHLMMAVTLKT
jgi:hypothetical protein